VLLELCGQKFVVSTAPPRGGVVDVEVGLMIFVFFVVVFVLVFFSFFPFAVVFPNMAFGSP